MIIIIEYDVVYLILRRSGPGHFLISQYLLQNIDISFYHPISLLTRILLFREWNRIVPKRLLWPSRTHKLFSILFHCIYSMDLHKLINVRYKFWKSFLPTFQKFFTPLLNVFSHHHSHHIFKISKWKYRKEFFFFKIHFHFLWMFKSG